MNKLTEIAKALRKAAETLEKQTDKEKVNKWELWDPDSMLHIPYACPAKAAADRLTQLKKQIESDLIAKGWRHHKEPDRIYVPDNIKFENGDIISENGKMVLFTNGHHGGLPSVSWAGKITDKEAYLYKGRPYLQKCNREELKQGDVAFKADPTNPLDDLATLGLYCVILNQKEHAYWSDNDMYISEWGWSLWYKVIFD